MTSTVQNYSNLINTNFPVPGEANDSQGFRTNFSNIQTALNTAADEITDIQVNAVNLSSTNDFGYNIIKRAMLQAEGTRIEEVGVISAATLNIDYAEGTYQTVTINTTSITITVINWPAAGIYGNIRLKLTPSSASSTNIGFGGTSENGTYTQTSPIFWEIWHDDDGTYAREIMS